VYNDTKSPQSVCYRLAETTFLDKLASSTYPNSLYTVGKLCKIWGGGASAEGTRFVGGSGGMPPRKLLKFGPLK
jgi:hypothetical protein